MKRHIRFLITVSLVSFATANATAQRPNIVVQSGHHQTIYTLALSPDKKLLASAGTDNVIIIWDTLAAKQLYSLQGDSQWVFALAFSPDGKNLVSGSADGIIRIWDVRKGTKVDEISIKPHGIKCVAFNRDGNKLAIGSSDNLIQIWNFTTKKFDTPLRGHNRAVEKLLFSLDDKSLVSVSSDNTLRLWDLATGFSVQVDAFPERPSLHVNLSLSPDGKQVVAASGNSAVFWNLKSKEKNTKSLPSDKEASINGVVFVSNDSVACQAAQKIWLWNLKTGVATLTADSYDNTGSAMTVSKDLNTLVFSHDESIEIYDLTTKQKKRLEGNFDFMNTAINVGFTSDSYSLLALHRNIFMLGDFFEVNMDEGLRLAARLAGPRYGYLSSRNSLVNFGKRAGKDTDSKPDFTVSPPIDSKEPDVVVKAHSKPIEALAVNPKKNMLATSSQDETLKIWNTDNWEKPQTILKENAHELSFSPDGEWLLSSSYKEGLKLWNTNTWESTPIRTEVKGIMDRSCFSPDGNMIAALITNEGVHQGLFLWRVKDQAQVFRLPVGPFRLDTSLLKIINLLPFPGPALMMLFFDITDMSRGWGPISFSSNSEMIAGQYSDPLTGVISVKVWDVKTGKELHELIGHAGAIRGTVFSYDNKILASSSIDNTVKLWSTKTGELLATIVLLNNIDWVVYTPDGRFDTNTDIEGDNVMHWSITGNALNALPLDVFMRDYYEPRLVERLLRCTDLNTCDQEFRHTRDISQLNINRPEVKITDISLPDANREVNVTVKVTAPDPRTIDVNSQPVTNRSGVYDLRLFRDRQLVGSAPSDGAERIERRKLEIDNAAPRVRFETEMKAWRESTEVKLDPLTGTQTVSFKVQLPKGKDAAAVKFTAYAFNEDRVKSSTAKYEWTPEQIANLPKADPQLRRRAYIVSVGVNHTRISKFSLRHADYDADQFQQVVTERLRQTGAYDVIPVRLVSTYENGKLTNDATKQNIQAAFDFLAGKAVDSRLRDKVPGFKQIQRATPDDLVIVTISSHGYSNNAGDFYLLPSDITRRRPTQDLPDLKSMISGEELALWLRDVQAEQMALIIDSCQAAAAVESLDFKPGPLGSRGFGQMAYDKQLRVLAATQAENRALEANGSIEGGLLTYALITEGLIKGEADSEAKDGKITLTEWLTYGANRVYGLYKRVVAEKEKGLVWKKVANSKDLDAKRLKLLQRGLLFNFSRENGDPVLSLTLP